MAVHPDGKVKCGPAHGFATLDKRYVNHTEPSSIDGGMVKDGSLTLKDVDVAGFKKVLQPRIVGKCAAGTAVAEVKADGTVACVDAGHGLPFVATVAAGKWYVAAVVNKLGATGVLTMTR